MPPVNQRFMKLAIKAAQKSKSEPDNRIHPKVAGENCVQENMQNILCLKEN